MRWLWTILLVLGAVRTFGADSIPDGFEPLFNGTDLTGWVGGTTIAPAAITPEQQAQWNAEIPDHWKVEGDQIVSDGHGPHLVTEKKFANFELLVDWNLAPNGDSGIYLRDCPQVQIWDPTNEAAHKHGSDKGSGALWNNQQHERWPLVKADKPCGEWNEMRIRMVGPHVLVVLNGELVVDNVVLENYYDRSKPVPNEGRIQLQTHGSETRFRKLWIRELGAKESAALLRASQPDSSSQ